MSPATAPSAAAWEAVLQGRPEQARPPTPGRGPRPAEVLKGASTQSRPRNWSGTWTPGLAPVASATLGLGRDPGVGIFNKGLEALSCQGSWNPTGRRSGGSGSRAGGRGVAGQWSWRPGTVSRVEHCLPAWMSQCGGRACVHTRVSSSPSVSPPPVAVFREHRNLRLRKFFPRPNSMCPAVLRAPRSRFTPATQCLLGKTPAAPYTLSTRRRIKTHLGLLSENRGESTRCLSSC